MVQYRKKPVVIEAEQFFYDGPRVRGVFYPDLSEDGRTWIGDAFVVTIHDQRVYLQSGDWIIAEPDGEHYYPVKPDIFAATYEPVEGDMFARGEMASGPATPGIEPAPTNSELQETLDIFSRLQSEHSDLIERERVLEAEAADLRRQLAELTPGGSEFQTPAACLAWIRARLSSTGHIAAERNDLRRQLAECQAKLASIPSAAIRRSFYTGYSSDAQVEEDEIAIAAWLEVQP